MTKKNDFMDELTEEFLSGNTTDVADVITFVEAPWGLNLTLFPVQKCVLKVYYGLPLDNQERSIQVPNIINDKILYEFTEVEFLKWLYEEGRCNSREIIEAPYTELILVMGRRSGKSTIASCISCYEVYKLVKRGDPSAFYGFPPDTTVAITNVAPTDDQASIVFNMLQKNVLGCPFLRDRIVNQTLTYFNVQTDSDRNLPSKKRRASIMSLAGGCASNSLRGHNNIVVVMDEMAHFIDNNGRFSGSEVYKALKPSIGSFKGDGKMVGISSPYAKYGQFWDLYVDSFNQCENTIMFQMYSSLVNPTIPSAFLRAERQRDRIGFMTEYAGEFSDKVTSWVDDEDKFKACIVRGRPKPVRGQTGTDYFMGVDLGVKNDGTAIVICHREQGINRRGKVFAGTPSRIIVDWAQVWFSGSSDVWEVSNNIYKGCNKYAEHDVIPVALIAEEIKNLCRWFPIKSGWFDQWNGYSLLEILHSMGLKQFRMEQVTDRMNSDTYQLFKTLYSEQMIEFYDDETLESEILGLEAERKSKARIEVRAPNKRGAHDDLADACARAIFEAYGADGPKNTNLTGGAGAAAIGSRGMTMAMKNHQRAQSRMHGAHPRRVERSHTRTRFV